MRNIPHSGLLIIVAAAFALWLLVWVALRAVRDWMKLPYPWPHIIVLVIFGGLLLSAFVYGFLTWRLF